MRHLRIWDDSVRSELSPCYVRNLDVEPMASKIFTNEIPWASFKDHASIFGLVVERNRRPERPDNEDAPQLTNAVWELAEKCWVEDPERRPTASAVCDIFAHLLGPTSAARQTPAPSPSRPTTPPKLLRTPVQASPPRLLTSPQNLIQGHTDSIYCAAFSSNGAYIVTGSCDRTIMVWNGQTMNVVLGPLKKHTASVHCVAFSPDGGRIASGSGDDTILVWHAITGEVVAGPFKGHDDIIWSVIFSPDGEKIVSSSRDKTIQVWDARTGTKLVDPLEGHSDGVTSVAFSGDGERLASGSRDKTIRVWDVGSGHLVRELNGPANWILFVAFSPDGKRIISGSWDGDVCVWDVDKGTLVSGPSKKHTEGSLAMVFTPNSTTLAVSPDGKWIVGYQNGDSTAVQVWDSKTGLLATDFAAVSVGFSPDSNRILSTSHENIIQVRMIDW